MNQIILGLIVFNGLVLIGTVHMCLTKGNPQPDGYEYINCRNAKDSLMIGMKHTYIMQQDSIKKANKAAKKLAK